MVIRWSDIALFILTSGSFTGKCRGNHKVKHHKVKHNMFVLKYLKRIKKNISNKIAMYNTFICPLKKQ